GDSFNGAYIAALVSCLSTSDAIGMAQRCAGQVIRHKGALVSFQKLGVSKE
ncbi:MAG: 2-dehydro-3-deoxygluconokinase, partial [Reinekea sp.]